METTIVGTTEVRTSTTTNSPQRVDVVILNLDYGEVEVIASDRLRVVEVDGEEIWDLVYEAEDPYDTDLDEYEALVVDIRKRLGDFLALAPDLEPWRERIEEALRELDDFERYWKESYEHDRLADEENARREAEYAAARADHECDCDACGLR